MVRINYYTVGISQSCIPIIVICIHYTAWKIPTRYYSCIYNNRLYKGGINTIYMYISLHSRKRFMSVEWPMVKLRTMKTYSRCWNRRLVGGRGEGGGGGGGAGKIMMYQMLVEREGMESQRGGSGHLFLCKNVRCIIALQMLPIQLVCSCFPA
jgi:hypothetical protein